jgi:hypothetical protein
MSIQEFPMKTSSLIMAAALAAFLNGCLNDTSTDPGKTPAPVISYATVIRDTLGFAAHHPVTSTGGNVTHYSIDPELPSGLTLDSITGLISGTPQDITDEAEYLVIAKGPGGRDTAAVYLEVVDSVPTPRFAQVGVFMGMKSAPGFALSRVVLTWTSSISTDSVIRDTLVAGQNGLSVSTYSDQSIAKSIILKAERSWMLKVVAFDNRDSVLYQDTGIAASLLAGEYRNLTLNLAPRFTSFVVSFSVPDSIRPAGGGNRRALNLNRYRISVNGVAIADTLKPSGYFPSGSPAATLLLLYVPVEGSHSIGLQMYGVHAGWSSALPLYAGALTGSNLDTTYVSTIPWTGPGSPQDPNYNPSSPANIPGLTVNASRYNPVIFYTPDGPEVLIKRAAR